ncbi:MAG: hypothetical protein CME64_16835 [Halobacteriovoraceae bacterium]|nr:hypothetical protein [Halobacteriovoraceae bacterium]|tara:strand:- start:190572 stop:190958 length:387 start_codon:yes stop_codon:yes gene_type:complete
MSRLHYNRLWWLLGVIGLAIILVFSILPNGGGIVSLNLSDKALHFIAYFFAAFYFKQISHSLLKVVILLTLYGVFIEGIQYLSVYRSSEWLDILANISGTISGALITKFTMPKLIQNIDQKIKAKLDY